MTKSKGERKLVKLFGSVSRARILGFLYAYEGRTFYQREIMYETGLSLRPVQRELGNLVDLGIVTKREKQNRVYYQVNPDFPLLESLRDICRLYSNEKDE